MHRVFSLYMGLTAVSSRGTCCCPRQGDLFLTGVHVCVCVYKHAHMCAQASRAGAGDGLNHSPKLLWLNREGEKGVLGNGLCAM